MAARPVFSGRMATGLGGKRLLLPTNRTRFMSNCKAQRLVVKCAQTVADLPASLQQIVGAFQMVPDPMQRYKQLLFFASKLPALPAEEHTPDNKVQGCVSQVWVVPELRDGGKLYWRADSDSQLTKGLAALLVQGLSGCTPQEILEIEPDFIEMLGLKQSLTPSRNNGFLNMFRLMQKKSLEMLASKAQQSSAANGASNGAATASEATPADVDAPTASSSSNGIGTTATSSTPVQDSMSRKITDALKPSRLRIVDESGQHAGHVGSRMKPGYSGETHFKVEIVSPAFEGLNSVKRHRLVYQLLQEELAGSVHALSLITMTPAEEQ